MDDLSHGVMATVIDLGLARMDADDAAGHRVRWTPFEEEIFEGEGLSYRAADSLSAILILFRPGDYQFDVYRMMRICNGNRWESYHPLTNVMVRCGHIHKIHSTDIPLVVALFNAEATARKRPPSPSSPSQSTA